MEARFRDRRHAGRLLGEALHEHAGRTDTVVLALPRGGVPVGYEVAERLAVPLDVLIVRKVGFPGHEELAMGAIASGGAVVDDRALRIRYRISDTTFREAVERERAELERREHVFRGDRPPVPVAGRAVILVDDGLATGSTMRAAIDAVRTRDPAQIIVAVPCGATSTVRELATLVDEIVCLVAREPFHAVGLWYDDFEQTTDDDVRELLADTERATPPEALVGGGP